MSAPTSMMAVVTTGNGGYDKLDYREVPTPTPGPTDVLLKVHAAGVNNTEINTRLGWYSSSVETATSSFSAVQSTAGEHKSDGGWNDATPFPIIQGTDCCGSVVAVGADVETSLIGQRGIVRACMRTGGWGDLDNVWMASDFDGAFAQYVTVPASEFFAVDTDWTDAGLATIPCAYATSENMIDRAGVGSGSVVLVTGASGGVGSATVQLAMRRGAQVIAVTSPSKAHHLRGLGVDQVIDRGADLVATLGEKSVDVVVDNVAGQGFAQMLKILKRGGRFVSSGAIAGPMVQFDIRDMYLKDIQLIGCTAWDEQVFPNLVGYIERNEIKPLVARQFPLSEIAQAQREFMDKDFFGNFVLIP